MKDKFEYTLASPISVSVGKDQDECSNVVVHCPKNSDSRWQLEFEHYVTKAAMGTAKLFPVPDEDKDKKKKIKEETEEEKEKSWRLIIMSCSDPKDFRCMVNLLADLMCSGNREKPQATIGGTKFTKPIFDELSAEDIKNILGRYVYHFLSRDLK